MVSAANDRTLLRRPGAALVIAAAEAALLFLYYSRAERVWVGFGSWFRSFEWAPVTGPFAWTPFIAVWLMAAAAGLCFLAWLFLAGAIGHTILLRLDWNGKGLERLLIAIGLGLGSLSLILFALCAGQWLTRPVVSATSLVLFAGCAWIERRSANRGAPKIDWGPKLDAKKIPLVFWIVAAICAAAWAFHFFGALLPPVSFDEMNYQLSLPKLYILRHGFAYTRFNHLSFLPRNMNMLFALGLLTGGSISAKLFSWACGTLACAALFVFGREIVGDGAAALAAAIFFLTPVVGNQFRLAVVDLGMSFFELTAVFLFLRWRKNGSDKTLLLSSVFWGFALGCKYNAIPGFAACGLVFCLDAARRPASWNKKARAAALYLCPALVLWLPWLLKNWMDTGNPIDPILSTVIPSRNFFFAGAYRPLVDYSKGLGIEDYFRVSGWREALRLPWHLLTRHNDFNHDLGAAWLLCLPLAGLSLGRKIPKPLVPLAAVCALYWLFWSCMGIHMTRYFVAGLGLSSLLAGWLIAPAIDAPRWRWALLAPVLFALFQQASRMVYIQNVYKRPWGYLAGRCSLRDYLEGTLADSPYDAYAYVNENTPPNSTVLVFNEFRTYYLDRNFLASTPWDHDYWHELVRMSADCPDLSARMRAQGIDYLVTNDNYAHSEMAATPPDPWTADDLRKSHRFLHRCMDRVYTSGDGVWVAKLKEDS